jgi:hypothetical protein
MDYGQSGLERAAIREGAPQMAGLPRLDRDRPVARNVTLIGASRHVPC